MLADERVMERFREIQPLRENRVVWPLVPIFVVLLAAALHAFWTSPTPGVHGLACVVLGVVVALLGWGELRTAVYDDSLRLQFVPMTRKRCIPWRDIASVGARQYRPLREYGGWGVRYGPSGSAWNVRGKKGVQLVFVNGKRLLIGSQRAEELALAIEAARSRNGG